MKILQIFPMYHEEGEKILTRHAEVIKIDTYDKGVIIEHLRKNKIDGIVLRAPAVIDAEIIDAANTVKAIAGAGVGLDNVDVMHASKKKIAVLHAPKVNSDSTAEHTVALIFSLFKNILPFQREMKDGNYFSRDSLFTYELKNKRLGLIGFGTIAQKVAKICQVIGMDIVSYVRMIDQQKEEIANTLGVELTSDIKKVFQQSDIISIHIPLTNETRGLIDQELLGLMKSTAYLVNTARGAIIKEDDLYQLLKDNKIAGAALDVFAVEPPAKDNALFKLDNVIFTPHVGGVSEEAAKLSSSIVAQSLIDTINGKIPKNVANAEIFR